MVAAAALLWSGLANAAAPAAVALSPADAADLHRIETYLGGITTLEAGFEQDNQDGTTAAGKLWLSRPGKMRFEYQPPAEMMIVSNGDYVAVDDTALKQVQFYPVASTPAWFLLRGGIQLTGDVTVTRFERGPASLRVTCVETKDPNSGSMTMVFSDAPLALRQWSVLDQQGRTTSVSLEDPVQGVSLDPSLFRLPAAPSKAGVQPGQDR
jgi:outer membrane lipoprotein-sorting protein